LFNILCWWWACQSWRRQKSRHRSFIINPIMV